MTDYLGAVHSPNALAGSWGPPDLKEAAILRPRRTSDQSDWILYMATALFMANVLLCWLR